MRNKLLRAGLEGATHSFYTPLSPLLEKLAALVLLTDFGSKNLTREVTGSISAKLFRRLILANRNRNFYGPIQDGDAQTCLLPVAYGWIMRNSKNGYCPTRRSSRVRRSDLVLVEPNSVYADDSVKTDSGR